MSKNTSSDAFRKLRVELFDGEEIYRDDDAPAAADDGAIAAKEGKCRELLNVGSAPEALKLALENPPIGASAEAKDRAYKVVIDVLSGFKSAEVAKTVKTLSSDECDTLMKYVYRGMAAAEDGLSTSLLLWHGSIVETFGLGPIVRVLSDRKTV